MYDLIVVPVDGSTAGRAAVEHAARLAAVHDAAVHVVHVIEPQAGHESTGPEITAALEQIGEQALTDAEAAAHDAGLETIETLMRRGQPYREIVAYAEEAGADLIVMTTHGRTGVERLLLGSVAEKVVRLSRVPVLTVRPDEPEE
ncbi:MAG: universal stress protein [Salinirussus sp.]